MSRLLKTSVRSPALIVASLGLVAGIGLMVVGLLYGPARPGRTRLVGGVVITLSSMVIYRRLTFRGSARPPDGGNELSPSQEAALDAKAQQKQNLVASGRS